MIYSKTMRSLLLTVASVVAAATLPGNGAHAQPKPGTPVFYSDSIGIITVGRDDIELTIKDNLQPDSSKQIVFQKKVPQVHPDIFFKVVKDGSRTSFTWKAVVKGKAT